MTSPPRNRFTASKPSRPLRQLLAPMLLASLALHGLVLMLPSGSSSDVVIPPPDPEQDSVAITRVPPAGTPDTEAAPPPLAPAVAPATVGTAATPVQPQPTRPSTPVRPAQASPAAARPRGGTTQSTPRANGAVPPSTSADSPPSATPATPPAPPSAPSASQPLFEGDLGERLRAYVAGLSLSPERIEQLRAAILQRVTYTAEATTTAAYEQNLSQWQQTIRTETGLSDLTPAPAPEDLAVTVVQRACLSEPPGPVQAGVLVSPSGTVRSQPVVLRSSGYGVVDDRALQAVASHQFPSASEARAFTVTIATELAGQSDCLRIENVAQEAGATGT
ncbi:energy transducer TonB [Leptolyngbya sp. KIOST-1]|uniref:energy transducer TonB n=1 Tax=Leptolyngbya sp. KIOST-1 TaxID=1229172 RepID=UPI0012E00D0C|nr:hypothetical protein [Leptolyngbya sp. KIOST-1]